MPEWTLLRVQKRGKELYSTHKPQKNPKGKTSQMIQNPGDGPDWASKPGGKWKQMQMEANGSQQLAGAMDREPVQSAGWE